MRRTIQVLAVFVLAVVVRNLPYIVGDREWKRLSMPFRAAQIAARPPDTALKMPVQGVRPRQVANTWHAPRSPHRLHEGEDIFARRGTPVRSATDGIVWKIGDNMLGGHCVWVLGPGGRTYYYAHLDHWAEGLYTGEDVEPGTLLGYVGNTGNARTTPPHLHFGIYGPTGAIDPLPLLRNGVSS